jgi:ATP-dependent DNA helicase RecG
MRTDWPTLLEELIERFGSPETAEIELKSAQGGLPASLWETVSAFANAHGGWLLLGAVEQKGYVAFEGLSNPAARMTDFFSTLRNKTKISYPVCDEGDVTVAELGPGGASVLVIRVPAAPRSVRPVYINNNPLTGSYLRHHNADFRCTEQEVRRMYREAGATGSDAMILPGFTADDLDSDTVEGFRQRFRARDPGSPWNRYQTQPFLEAVGAFGRDRVTGESGITVAGLLFLGKSLAIRDWRRRHVIDYQRLPSDPSPDHRWDDRVAWEGNLLGAFDSLYPRLVSGLATPFRLQGVARRDEGPEQTVVREALVNLLAHTDYFETDASLIQRSPDGYRFRNPGDSRVPAYDLFNKDRSDPRNPLLVRMFRLAGLAEEAGQGIATIRTLWQELGYRLPSIDVGAERYEFDIRLRYAHLMSEEDRRWLDALGQPISEMQRIALVLARHGEEVTNARLCQLSGSHPADVTKALRELRGWSLLDMDGGGRWASYRLSSLAEIASDVQRATRGSSDGERRASMIGGDDESMPTVGAACSNDRTTGGASALSAGASALSLRTSAGASALSGVRNANAEQDERLARIAEIAKAQKRIAPEQFDDLLVRLCGVLPLSRAEIAGLTGRSQDWVSRRVSALVRADRLRLLYPDIATHPAQRYLSAERDR